MQVLNNNDAKLAKVITIHDKHFCSSISMVEGRFNNVMDAIQQNYMKSL